MSSADRICQKNKKENQWNNIVGFALSCDRLVWALCERVFVEVPMHVHIMSQCQWDNNARLKSADYTVFIVRLPANPAFPVPFHWYKKESVIVNLITNRLRSARYWVPDENVYYYRKIRED